MMLSSSRAGPAGHTVSKRAAAIRPTYALRAATTGARPHAAHAAAAAGLRQLRAPRLATVRAATAGAAAAAPSGSAAFAVDALPRVPPGEGPIVVWFKHDLRVSDHPGLLAAAATGRPVVPLFVLDPDAYADLALQPCGPRALAGGVRALRAALRALGSDLVVRVGAADAEVAALCAEVGADTVLAEREVEARWLELKHRMSLELARRRPAARVATWAAPLYSPSTFDFNYRQWKKARGSPLPPLPPPAQLPPLPALPGGAEAAGKLPGDAEVEGLLKGALAAALGDAAARRVAEAAAAEAGAGASSARAPLAARAAPFVARLLDAIDGAAAADGADASAAAAGAGPTAAGGPAEVAALRAYLGARQGGGSFPAASPGGLGFLGEAVGALEGPANPGGSFLALLGRPLVRLGRLSARQVHAEALEFERRRWGGRAPPITLFGAPTTPEVATALDAAELSDFHSQLAAASSNASGAPGGARPRAPAPRPQSPPRAPEPVASVSGSYEEAEDGSVASFGVSGWPAGAPRRCAWRWRGALTDYCVAEPPAGAPQLPPGAPAVLLCHGFGAFGDQWRGNLAPIAAAGFRVYAPTLPGFGRSEKAPIGYSQEAWRDYLRDFVLRVVKGPVVLVGNSIGGFISASLAADYPDLVRGLVLVNSAGPIDPSFDIAAHAAATKSPPPAWVAKALTAGLMAYLEGSIAKQLRWLYPTAPDRADAWLEQEIFRAACDGRSPDVFRSVFYLPPPRALNWMVAEAFKGPTLVLQGVLDPLNDAAGRAAQLEALCPNARAVTLQAGHCPQDEQPEAVNSALLRWIGEEVLPRAGAPGGGGEAVAAAAGGA